MKKIPAFLLSLIVIACGQKGNEKLTMTGAYYMTSQVINDGTKDSSIDRKQLKIYTDKYMMFATPNLTDSFATYGIGTYTVDGNKVTENVFYRSAAGEVKESVVLDIEQTPNGYRQVIENIDFNGRNVKLTEEYERVVNAPQRTALDGAWKQTRNIYVTAKGDSSVNTNVLEYKTYQSGYFIWAITTRDSANQPQSVFGYGPFEMVTANKSRETVQNSTFVQGLIGRTYEVDIQFPAPDTYQQTITFANGDKSIEIYQKLK